MIVFGTGGIPIQAKKASTLEGLKCVKELGLGAMELEFVHGVRLTADKAMEVKEVNDSLGLKLSCHAPYYISLISKEHSKRKNSHKMILDSARALHVCGGGKVIFHPGFYGDWDKEKAFEEMKQEFLFLLDELKKEKLAVELRPEVTGKLSAWGSLEELMRMREETGIKYCIDFSHVHARSNGGLDSEKEWRKLFESIESANGKKVFQDLHCHMQGVEFTPKGERSHLPLSSESPPFKPLMQLLVEYDCSGTIISESPILESDALLMKKTYEALL
ncbi:TIM barrel protein [Candidatus Micrarchaeota archaeon]|nr:TIM barrel protein [Candidatus Micrarchaeota archaeon]